MGWDSEFPKVYIDLAGGKEVDTTQGLGRVLRLMRDQEGNIIRGPDGKPIEAHAYSFYTEEQGDRQFTVLDVLGTKSGERLGGEEHPEAPIPRPRTHAQREEEPVASVEVLDVITSIVGSAALEGEVEVSVSAEESEHASAVNPLAPSGWPNQSGLREFIEAHGGDSKIPPNEAARLLGVSTLTLKSIFKNLWGDPNHQPTLNDTADILEMYPDLKAPPLPEAGFMDIEQFARQSTMSERPFAVIRYARAQGYTPNRFTDEYGTVGFYLHELTAAQLLNDTRRDGLKF
jgi:hypothetical protein